MHAANELKFDLKLRTGFLVPLAGPKKRPQTTTNRKHWHNIGLHACAYGHLVGQAGGLAKGGAAAVAADQHAGLARQQLDHLADRHAGGETVRVHDEVGADAGLAERHVRLWACNGILSVGITVLV